ncbi:MAG: GNAT family N-acetyltransferase [Candidatus Tumulicola sp.]
MAASSKRYAIRKALDADIALLPAIEYAADELFRQQGIGPLPSPADEETYRRSLFTLVAGDPPVGFVRAIEIDGEFHLEQMSVVPKHTWKGVGSELLCHVIEAARECGYARLTLITFAHITWNAPFYLKRGFNPLPKLTTGLKRLREREKALGLDQLGSRVVLALNLDKKT